MLPRCVEADPATTATARPRSRRSRRRATSARATSCGHTTLTARHLSFEGRLKDNIDRGGEKFGTEEIELLLAEHPAVREARVVGMPDPYLGQRVCAFVIAGDAGVPTVEDLGGFLLERGLAKFKLPERVEPIDEMPVTAVGKLDRSALRERIAATLAAEAARA